MAKSGFKIALGVVKSIDKEMKRSARAAERRQRQQASEDRKYERELERRRKQVERDSISVKRTLAASNKARIKEALEEEKDAYEDRCEDRKILREQFIDEEIK